MNAFQRYAVLNIQGESCQVTGYLPWHPGRKQVEQFIATRFQREHGAQLQHFMPLLVALQNSSGEVLAVAGIRSAMLEPLFLEYYLDHAIEHVVQQFFAVSGARHEVVEVGNLAAVKAGYGRYLFAVLTDLLTAWEFRWLCCTGVAGVLNLFRRLDMEPLVVAPANPARIPGGGKEWGEYYQKKPHVLLGEISRGRQRVDRCGLLQACGYQREEESNVISA